MPARTRAMTATEVRTRAQHAHAFVAAADLVGDLGQDAGIDDVGNIIGSLAVLAGIAASDAICGAVLGERPAGGDHGEAVAMLRRTQVGKSLAQHLARLINAKTETQYSPLLLTEARATDLLKASRRLVDGMDDLLQKIR